MTAIVLPAMVHKRKGVVINVSSAAGCRPVPFMALYSSTKVGWVFFILNSRYMQTSKRGRGGQGGGGGGGEKGGSLGRGQLPSHLHPPPPPPPLPPSSPNNLKYLPRKKEGGRERKEGRMNTRKCVCVRARVCL